MTDIKIQQYIEKVKTDIEKYNSCDKPGYYRTFNHEELLKRLNELLNKQESYDKKQREFIKIKKTLGLTKIYRYNTTQIQQQHKKTNHSNEQSVCQNCGFTQEVIAYNEFGLPYCTECFATLDQYQVKTGKPNKIEDQSKKCQKKIDEFQGLNAIPYFVANYFNLLLLRDYLRLPKVYTDIHSSTTNEDDSMSVTTTSVATTSRSSKSERLKFEYEYITSDHKDELYCHEISFPFEFKTYYKKNKHIENPQTNMIIKQQIPWSEILLKTSSYDIKLDQIPKKMYIIDLNIHQIQTILKISRNYMSTDLPLGCQYAPSDNCCIQSLFRQLKQISPDIKFSTQDTQFIEELYLKFVDQQKTKQVQTGERSNLMIIQQFIHQVNLSFKLQPVLESFFKGKDINQNIIEFVEHEYANKV